MLNQQTLNQLKALRLDGMARAFAEQLTLPIATALAFEDRFAQLVDREIHWRDNQRRERLLKQAKLKHPQACLEDLDQRPGRGLDKPLIATLANGDWIRQAHALLIGGPTGTGKTWMACALGQQACRQGFSVNYVRVPRLLEALRIAHGDGSFGKRLVQLARIDLLILDDWGMTPLDQTSRHDLLEVIDDRVGSRSTIVTSQLPIEHWHGWLNDPTLADAILDRLVHQSYRLTLKGESLRKPDPAKPQNHPKDD
jgi:DNA replication protein DnaC